MQSENTYYDYRGYRLPMVINTNIRRDMEASIDLELSAVPPQIVRPTGANAKPTSYPKIRSIKSS